MGKTLRTRAIRHAFMQMVLSGADRRASDSSFGVGVESRIIRDTADELAFEVWTTATCNQSSAAGAACPDGLRVTLFARDPSFEVFRSGRRHVTELIDLKVSPFAEAERVRSFLQTICSDEWLAQSRRPSAA